MGALAMEVGTAGPSTGLKGSKGLKKNVRSTRLKNFQLNKLNRLL